MLGDSMYALIVESLTMFFFFTVSPTIIEFPESETVVLLEDATFSCLATARPRPDITWWRVEEDGSMTQVATMQNATIIEEAVFGERERISNLTILEAQPRDAGAYVCVAGNVFADVSALATLTVHGTQFY